MIGPLTRRRRRRALRRPDPAATRRTSILWGVATLAAAAFGVHLIFGGGLPGGSGRTVTVIARDAGALRAAKATKVRVAGVDVGHVASVTPDPRTPGLAEIVLALDDDAPVVRRDATLEIRPRLFLEGNFFVDLRPGSPSAPALAGRSLPPSSTTVHVAVDEVLRTFDTDTRGDLQATLDGLGRTLDDGGARALRPLVRATPELLAHVATVARAVRGEEPGDLPALVRSTSRTLDVLGRRRDALAGGVRDGRRTFDALASTQADLGATVRGLDRATAALPPALRRIDAVVPAGRGLAADARPLVRRLPSTLDAAAPGLRSVLALTRSGDPRRLLRVLRPTTVELAAAAEPLGDGLATLTPVAACLRENLTPVLKATVPDGPLSTDTPVYAEFLSAMVGLASGAQEFDGNGPWVRYLLGLGNQLISTGGPAESLVGRATAPIAGSSPTPTTPPALRPDVPCEGQPVAALTSDARPYRAAQRSAPIDQDRVGDASERFAEAGRRAAGRAGSPTGVAGAASSRADRVADDASRTADDGSKAAGAPRPTGVGSRPGRDRRPTGAEAVRLIRDALATMLDAAPEEPRR
jgi:ABC-type transporter Mla subunit MlaD